MKIREHLERAAAFEQAIVRLDPAADTELFIVFLMRAATARVNAALHALGITSDVMGGAGGKLGDLNHTYKPRLEAELPPNMKRAFACLAFLEDLRPDFVRGSRILDDAGATACHTAYAEIRALTASLLENEASA